MTEPGAEHFAPDRTLLAPTARVALIIAMLALAAYATSFSVFYLFDDASSIDDNPTIRHLWPPGPVLSPPTSGTPVSGRPLVNLTFAINYAISGEAVWSYHVVNLAIHVLAALALFGVVRRTLLLPSVASGLRNAALKIAGAVAALWAVHPLQTESVTYISQRAEALMGLFYLLTLYLFIRGVTEKRWEGLAASVAACLAGMGSKEVMVSAPLIVLLYDRTFLAGNFLRALRTRPRYYLTLAATWILLAYEMVHVGNRGGAAGMGLKIDAWHYALTQLHAIVLYLGLSIWPHPLIFDYGTTLVGGFSDVWPDALIVAVLMGATAILIWKRSAFGFLGAWFFAILAPTSSVVPLVKQTIAEHRMYLPLAAVITLVVLAFHAVVGRFTLAVAVLVIAGVTLTLERNAEYLDGVTIWSEAVAHYPDNPRSHIDLGNAYVQSGRPELAAEQYRAAIRLDPTLPEPHNNLGVVEAGQGNFAEAEAEYREAMRLLPGWDKPQRNLDELEAAQKTSSTK